MPIIIIYVFFWIKIKNNELIKFQFTEPLDTSYKSYYKDIANKRRS